MNSGLAESVQMSGMGVRSLGIFIVFEALAFTMLLLRLSSRWRRLKALGLDDLLVTCAWAVSFTAGAIVHVTCRYSLGAAALSRPDLVTIIRSQFIFGMLFYLSLALTQISVALNYKKFGGCLGSGHKKACDILVCIIALGFLVECMAFLLQCLPVAAIWQLEKRPTARCYDVTTFKIFVIYGPPVFRTLVDLCLIAVPVPIILGLRLRIMQKIGILAVICFTCVSIMASIQRMILTQPSSDSDGQLLMTRLPSIQILGDVEITVAIICACLVTLRSSIMEWWKQLSAFMCFDRHSRGSAGGCGGTIVAHPQSQHCKAASVTFAAIDIEKQMKFDGY